jgi:ATP-dependent RNA helicase RhlE
MPKDIRDLAGSILNNPIHIKVNVDTLTTDTINQKLYYVNGGSKRQLLQQIVKRNDLNSIIVFANTKDKTDDILEYLEAINIKSDIIHRNRTQNGRQKALNNLKK